MLIYKKKLYFINKGIRELAECRSPFLVRISIKKFATIIFQSWKKHFFLGVKFMQTDIKVICMFFHFIPYLCRCYTVWRGTVARIVAPVVQWLLFFFVIKFCTYYYFVFVCFIFCVSFRFLQLTKTRVIFLFLCSCHFTLQSCNIYLLLQNFMYI